MATALAQSAPPAKSDMRRELEDRYRQQNEVPIGGSLELPQPWNMTVDTSRLTEPPAES
jgi:hypothetical protein